jgi:fatty-acid desaturase
MNAAASAIADKFGVIHDPRLDRWTRVRIGLSIFLPLAGTCVAIADFPTTAPTSITIIVFAVLFTGTALGINLGLHRYFTHASFSLKFLRGATGILR